MSRNLRSVTPTRHHVTQLDLSSARGMEMSLEPIQARALKRAPDNSDALVVSA